MLASIRCEIAIESNPIETAIVVAAARTNLRASPSDVIPELILPDGQIIIVCLFAKRGTAPDDTVRSHKDYVFPRLVN